MEVAIDEAAITPMTYYLSRMEPVPGDLMVYNKHLQMQPMYVRTIVSLTVWKQFLPCDAL